MWFEVGCFAFAGLAQIARTTHRFAHRGARFWSVGGGAGRSAGGLLLVLSLVAAAQDIGIVLGLIAWVGFIMLSGIALVLILSTRPRIAFLATPILAATGALVAVF